MVSKSELFCACGKAIDREQVILALELALVHQLQENMRLVAAIEGKKVGETLEEHDAHCEQCQAMGYGKRGV